MEAGWQGSRQGRREEGRQGRRKAGRKQGCREGVKEVGKEGEKQEGRQAGRKAEERGAFLRNLIASLYIGPVQSQLHLMRWKERLLNDKRPLIVRYGQGT